MSRESIELRFAGTLRSRKQLQASGDGMTQVGWTPKVRGAGDVQKLGYTLCDLLRPIPDSYVVKTVSALRCC